MLIGFLIRRRFVMPNDVIFDIQAKNIVRCEVDRS